MQHQLNISIDFEEGQPLFSHNVKILLDGVQLGMIQHITLHAEAKETLMSLAIESIDTSNFPSSSQLKGKEKILATLETVPNAKITYQTII